MMFSNHLYALILAAALSHTVFLPYEAYDGKFICEYSHWRESPRCCNKQCTDNYDECEPGITDHLPVAPHHRGRPRLGLTKRVTVDVPVGRDMMPVDPCVGPARKPDCCGVPEEERVRIRVWRVRGRRACALLDFTDRRS